MKNNITIPKGRCLVMAAHSAVIVMENLDMYEILKIPDEVVSYKDTVVVKLPAKATIDFEKVWGHDRNGDSSSANWVNTHLPVCIEDGKLIWDY